MEKVVNTAQRKPVFGPAGPEAAGSFSVLHPSLHFSLLTASTFLPGPALHHLRGWVHLGFNPALLLTSHEMLESSPKDRPGIIKAALSLCFVSYLKVPGGTDPKCLSPGALGDGKGELSSW